jgi:orotate phosphoribosyltransferase-like protein
MKEAEIEELICSAPDISSQGWADEKVQKEVNAHREYMKNVVKILRENGVNPSDISDDWLRNKVERTLRKFGSD